MRLCKGIYLEPRTIAWKDFDTVRANFIYAMEQAAEGGGLRRHRHPRPAPGVRRAWPRSTASASPRTATSSRCCSASTPSCARSSSVAGHRLRVYVPYGRDWYPYSMRRLRENPTIALHVMRAMFGLS